MKTLTYKQYRSINLVIFFILFGIAETLVTYAAGHWFADQLYVLSVSILYMCLEEMRWGGFVAFGAVAIGIISCMAAAAEPEQYLIYCAGNLFMLLGLVFLKLIGKEKVRRDTLLTVTYALLVFLLAETGRGLVSVLLGSSPMMIVQFLTTDALSGVFAIVALIAVRNADGIYEDQRHYLKRLEEARRAEEEQ